MKNEVMLNPSRFNTLRDTTPVPIPWEAIVEEIGSNRHEAERYNFFRYFSLSLLHHGSVNSHDVKARFGKAIDDAVLRMRQEAVIFCFRGGTAFVQASDSRHLGKKFYCFQYTTIKLLCEYGSALFLIPSQNVNESVGGSFIPFYLTNPHCANLANASS